MLVGYRTVFIALLITVLPAVACQVPVFRYALERWPPDFYQLVIFHEEPLTEAQEAVYKDLKARVDSEELPANMHVDTLNVLEKPDHDLAVWFKQQEDVNTPSMVLFYPTMNREILPAWKGEVTEANAARLLDSPYRRQILGGILRGDSAVWVLLESGNKEKDDALVTLLNTQLKEVRDVLEIPDGVMTQEEAEEAFSDPQSVPFGFDPSNVLRSEIPLHINFSVMRMSREAEGEDIFHQMLLNRYSDVPQESEVPLLYVVFGQGRVLGPITEAEIEEDAIYSAAQYLCGACSCEVKAQNPGMDVVMSINWWSKLEGSQVIEDKTLPPLIGTADILAQNQPEEAEEPLTPPEETNEETGTAPAPPVEIAEEKPFRISLGVGFAVAFVVMIGTVGILSRKFLKTEL